jgi:hypothetical protein
LACWAGVVVVLLEHRQRGSLALGCPRWAPARLRRRRRGDDAWNLRRPQGTGDARHVAGCLGHMGRLARDHGLSRWGRLLYAHSGSVPARADVSGETKMKPRAGSLVLSERAAPACHVPLHEKQLRLSCQRPSHYPFHSVSKKIRNSLIINNYSPLSFACWDHTMMRGGESGGRCRR